MAKAKALTPIVIQQPRKTPARPRGRAIGKKAKKAVSHGWNMAKKEAYRERHKLVAMGAAALLGYIKAKGIKIPYSETLGLEGTMALVSWIAAKYMKNEFVDRVSTGLSAVWAFQQGQSWGKPKQSTSGLGDTYDGETGERIQGGM